MKQQLLSEGLSYEDVLIHPRRSDIRSRYGNQINTSALIARGAPRINLPFVSANMDTVTEAPMATEMALHGGLGIIHRFMVPIDQAEHVRRVKDKMRVIEEDPPMVSTKATITDALELISKRKRGYAIVYEGKSFSGKFVGIATSRDFIAAPVDTLLMEVMTPNNSSMVTVKKGTSMKKAIGIMRENRVEKVPVVDVRGNLVGVYALTDAKFMEKYPNSAVDSRGRLMVGAAIGVKDTDIDRAHLLVEMGVDILVIDIAHGHLDYMGNMLSRLKKKEKIKIPIVAGNIATAKGALYLHKHGADAVKVGIGPGFVCETRDIAGVGVPQITAIMNVVEALKGKIPVIADGGVRKPADANKALVAGADTVMMGSVFAGTDKSPGDPVTVSGQLMKSVRGMASSSAFKDRLKLGDTTTDPRRYVPEGRHTFTPYKGKTSGVIFQFDGGLRSSMSYVGAHNLTEFRKLGQLMKISPAGAGEQKRSLG